MPFDAGAAVGRMGLDVSGYVSGILQAQTISAVMPQVVTNFIANPLLAVIGIAQSTGRALTQMFRSSTDAADNMDEMATAAGVSVEALSGLGRVAKENGSDVQGVADAFKFLGKSQAEAINGSKEGKASFAALGVAFANADGSAKSLDGLLLEVGDALYRLPSAGQRTAAAMDLLGRGGTGMLATFKQGSASIREQIDIYTRLGGVITQSQAQSAGAWNDAMDKMGAAWDGFKQMLIQPIRTALMPMLESLVAWVAENPGVIQATISKMAGVIVEALDVAGNVVMWITENFRELAQFVVGTLVGVAIFKLVGAIISIGSAFKAAAIGSAIFQLVTNPLNIVKLAAAAVATAVAIGYIETAFDNATVSAARFQAKNEAAMSGAKSQATDQVNKMTGGAGGNTVNVKVDAKVDGRGFARDVSDAVRKKLESQQELMQAGVFRDMVGRAL
jgi:hypothetical protein